MTDVRKRGTHETGMIFQARRLLVELEKISMDTRKILEAWLENAEEIAAAAERQEKARAVRNKNFTANQIRLFGQRLEAVIESLPDTSRAEQKIALGYLNRFTPHFTQATATIPFENEPRIRIRFEGENEPIG